MSDNSPRQATHQGGRTLRVSNWGDRFENNRTRELKRLEWLPLPTRLDGDGYAELIDHPDGAAHFAAWVIVLAVAAQCVPRGNLIRENGRPHDAASLARMSRIPTSVFEAAIPRLLDIGWLEEVSTSPQATAAIPHNGAEKSQRDAGISRAPAASTAPSCLTGQGIHTPEDSTAPQAAADKRIKSLIAYWTALGVGNPSRKLTEMINYASRNPDLTAHACRAMVDDMKQSDVEFANPVGAIIEKVLGGEWRRPIRKPGNGLKQIKGGVYVRGEV